MATNNDNIDNNLDEQIDDINIFDDYNLEDPSVKGRKPSGAGRVIIKNLLSASSAFTKTAAAEVEQSMPKTSGLIGEFMEIKDALSEFKQEFREQYAPTINEVRKAMYKSLPMAERYIPKQLYDKIEKALEGYKEEVKQAQKTDEQRQSEKISASIAEIFAAQEEIRAGERTEERVNDMVEKVTAATRHAETKKLLSSISNSLYYQSNFIKTTQTAWMKKMLELKYISVFTQRETLNTLKVQATMLETKLEELKHNNAIPDWQKWTLTDHKDRLKKQFIVGRAMAAAPTIKGYIGETGKNLVGTAKQGVKGILQGIRSQASMLGTTADMASMLPSDEVSGIGTGIGKAIGSGLGIPGGRALIRKLRPFLDIAEEESQSIQDTAFFKAKHLKEKLEGKGSVGASFLASFLPTYTEKMDVENELLSDPTQPLPFDRATRQAIVEIIPAYLAKIAKYTRDTATGRNNEEERYDIVKRKMVSKSEALKSVEEYTFGKTGSRSQDSITAVGQLKAGLIRNIGTDEASAKFDEQQANLLKFVNNSAITNNILNPTLIREFALGNEKAINSNYINKVFRGIENPRAVAQLISMSIYDEKGKIDKKVVRQIEAAMVRASSAKTWRQRFPQMLEGQGTYDLFSDTDILKEGVVQEKELMSMMSDVSKEQLSKQVGDISETSLSQMRLREAEEEVLKAQGRKAAKSMRKAGRGARDMIPGSPYARLMRRREAQIQPWRESKQDQADALKRKNIIDYDISKYDELMSEGDAGFGFYSEGEPKTPSYEDFATISKSVAGTPIARDAVEAIVSLRDVSEASSQKQLAKLAEICQYQKSLEEKISDAFTNTEDKTGSLGPNDLFEKMQLDINTLVETTLENNEKMYIKVEDLLAAAELSLELAQKRTTDLSTLVSMTDKRMPKSTFGDTDFDNIREGSYADQMKEKAAKSKMLAYGMPMGLGTLGFGGKGEKQYGNAPGTPVNVSGGWKSWIPGATIASGLLTGGAGLSGFLRSGLNMLPSGMLKEGSFLSNYATKGIRGMAGSRVGGLLSKVLGSPVTKGVFRQGGRFASKAALPIMTAIEAGLGLRETLGNREASDAIAAELERKRKEEGLGGGMAGLAHAFNLSNTMNEFEKGNYLKSGWEATKGVFGSTKGAAELVGANITTGMDAVSEFAGSSDWKDLKQALFGMNAIEDPPGWGDWRVLDWNLVAGLKSRDLLTMIGSGKFSKEDEDAFSKFARFNSKKEQRKASERKEAAELAKATAKVGEQPQKAKTVTKDGKTVVDNYQSPSKQQQMQKEQVKEAVETMSTASQEMTMELIRETRETNKKQQQVIDALMGIKDNTGKLEDIDGKMKESVEQGKNPKVVVAPVDTAKAQPRVHRPSVNVAQRT